MTLEWDNPPDRAWPNLVQAEADAIEAEVVAYVESLLDEVEAWLKTNAPWQDRTGEARANLYSDIEQVVRQSVTLLMSHGPHIPYSVFLEHGFRGRYSVLRPALDYWQPVIFEGVRQIVRRHGG